jgi:hypothetical protein
MEVDERTKGSQKYSMLDVKKNSPWRIICTWGYIMCFPAREPQLCRIAWYKAQNNHRIIKQQSKKPGGKTKMQRKKPSYE